MVTEDSESICFRALADSTRREILNLLQQGPLPVQTVAERFPVSRPAISKHLRILRDAGLVLETKEGRQNIFSLDAEPLGILRRWLAIFAGGEGHASGGGGEEGPARRYLRRSPDEWRVW